MNFSIRKFSKISYSVLGAVILILFGGVFYIFLPFQYATENESNEKVIYYADNISPAHSQVIDRFNKLNKGKIRVECIDLPFTKFSTNERKELFARYLRGESDRIDIFSIDQIWIPRFARWCEPMGKYFSDPELERILIHTLKPCLYDDKLVSMPMFTDVSLMYFRSDILKELYGDNKIEQKLKASITWEEFIKIGVKLKSKNYPFYIFQADNYEGLVCSFIELLLSQTHDVSPEYSIELTSAEAIKALNFIVDLVNFYKISPSDVTHLKENNSYSYFIEKDGIFLRGWPNTGWDYINKNNDSLKMKYLVKIPLPHFEGKREVSLVGGWNLMISKFSNNKYEAAKFIKFCLSEEAQKIMFEFGGYLPVNKKIYEDKSYLKRYSELVFYKDLFKKGIYRPRHVNYTKISDILSIYIKSAIKKEISVAQALQNADERINSDFNIN